MDAYCKNSYRVNEYQFKIKITFPVADALFFNDKTPLLQPPEPLIIWGRKLNNLMQDLKWTGS